MRGDEWNRLVGEPTAMEVEAALADVRIRAVPIARRNARNRRAVSMLTAVLALGGAFFAGGLNAANGVHLGATPTMLGANEWKGYPSLEVAPGPIMARAPVSAGGTVRRFRVTSWTEWYGERFGEDEAWVEGPPGTSFAFRFTLPGGSGWTDDGLRGQVRAVVSADSVIYAVSADLRVTFGTSSRGLQLFEEGSSFQRLDVARGQVVTYYPQGRHGGDEPRAVIRIEGPDVAPPGHAVRWDSITGYAEQWLRNQGRDAIAALRAARFREVRFSNVRHGDLTLVPLFFEPKAPMRMAVVGRDDSGRYTANPLAQRVIVPGIRDTLRVNVYPSLDASMQSCFLATRNDWRAAQTDRAAGRKPFRAEGCFPRSDPWSPIEVTANNGQRLRVQLMKVPDVNY